VTDARTGAGGERLGEVPYLRPHPGAASFERRAARFRVLARGRALGDYLELCASLSAAQATAAAGVELTLPAREPAPVRPLRGLGADRGEWRDALGLIARELQAAPMPEASRQGLSRLGVMAPPELTELGGHILAGEFAGLDLAAALFAAAALQVQFAAFASQATGENVARAEPGCPLCGSPPMAGLVLGDAKLRYLVCGLCGSQWHLTRLTCSRCRSTGSLAYLTLEGDPGEVKAEVCSACKGYLKLFYVERRPAAEPQADDLATLALDQLVATEGYARIGVNLFLPV
jgi:FdhE protein